MASHNKITFDDLMEEYDYIKPRRCLDDYDNWKAVHDYINKNTELVQEAYSNGGIQGACKLLYSAENGVLVAGFLYEAYDNLIMGGWFDEDRYDDCEVDDSSDDDDGNEYSCCDHDHFGGRGLNQCFCGCTYCVTHMNTPHCWGCYKEVDKLYLKKTAQEYRKEGSKYYCGTCFKK
jgi:hypothetical protein